MKSVDYSENSKEGQTKMKMPTYFENSKEVANLKNAFTSFENSKEGYRYNIPYGILIKNNN